jgi:hypothetical protein
MICNSNGFYNIRKKKCKPKVKKQGAWSKAQRAKTISRSTWSPRESNRGASGVVSEKPQPGFIKARLSSTEFPNSSPEVAP